jgi:hypothetical protein
MSNAAEAQADENVVCGLCGIAEVDNIKLEDCDGCDLVKYCGDKCREEHREQHEEECKKRKAELHDDKKLFTQPDVSHLGECPLCFLLMPLDQTKTTFYSCCSTQICDGCIYVHHVQNRSMNCPFCRELAPDDEENRKRMMERAKANDPAALRRMGARRYYEGDYDVAFEYFTKAVELGDVESHSWLGVMYRKGEGVEKDEEKGVYLFKKAAIRGHPTARYNLGWREHESGNVERAVKHFIIAANVGDEKSMKALWGYYKDRNITKQELDATLRTHHAAINEMKSPERKAAEVWREKQRGA